MKKLFFFLIIVSFSSLSFAQKKMSTKDYVDLYGRLAIQGMQEYGIPASIKMAQAIIESNSGNSDLALAANNHFGIKCKNDWKGDVLSHDDDERNECFRRYKNVYDSYRDHSDFLSGSPRYRFLFDLTPTDYEGWAKGLAYAGYATNPSYSNMLIKTIKEYGLDQLDRQAMTGNRNSAVASNRGGNVPASGSSVVTSEPVSTGREIAAGITTGTTNVVVLNDPSNPYNPAAASRNIEGNASINNVAANNDAGYYDYDGPKLRGSEYSLVRQSPLKMYLNNGVEFVIANDGDTFSSIAKNLRTSPSKLRAYNDLAGGERIAPGSVIYVQPKSTKVTNGYKHHNVSKGETLQFVAQKYGVQIDRLAKKNNVDRNYVIKPGQKLNLDL